MIVPMKKMHIFMRESEKHTSLRILRSLGVMHVNVQQFSSGRIDELQEQHSELKRICDRVETTYDAAVKAAKHRVEEQIRVDEMLHRRTRLVEFLDEELKLEQRITEIESEIDRLESWGDFSPAAIHELAHAGIAVSLYEISPAAVEELVDYRYIVLERERKSMRIAVIGERPDESELMRSEPIPVKGLSELRHSLNFALTRKEQIRQIFLDESRYLKSYKEVLLLIEEELAFEEIHYGMDGNGDVSWVTGFVPEEDIPTVRRTAAEHSWGFIADEVSEEDQVSTKLKNNRLVRIIQPVFDILGTVPSYTDYDVSLFFLMFFAVFFAMIIGDAGYGALFLIGTAAVHLVTRKWNEPIKLLYVLSAMTLIWGAVTGTWFGSTEIIEQSSLLKSLVIPSMSSFPELFKDVTSTDTRNTVMYISFVLGILQLSIACIVNFIREMPQKKAFAQLGWLLLLIGLYFLVLQMVIGVTMPGWAIYAIAGGLLIFVIFNQQGEGVSFGKGLALGLGGLFNTFLDAISGFSNIISYIRLFAVGMASVAIASSFNSMASPLMGGWTVPAAILILLLGHGLNLIMGLLSVVVHGVRLNMLEFSGQLNMNWTGIKYEPFMEHVDSSLQEDSRLLPKE